MADCESRRHVSRAAKTIVVLGTATPGGGFPLHGGAVAEASGSAPSIPFWKPLTIAAGSYPGQAQPIQSVGSWSFLLARPGLDDDMGHRLARALHRGEAARGERLPQARERRAANTVAAAAPDMSLVHPGVLRYLNEIGVARTK